MKFFYQILIAIIGITSVANAQQTTHFSGLIEYPEAPYLLLTHGEKKDTIVIDPTGSFEKDIISNGEGYVMIQYKEEKIELFHSGADTVIIETDGGAYFLDGMQVSGTNKRINKYLQQKTLQLKFQRISTPNFEQYEQDVFLKYLDSANTIVSNYFTNYFRKNSESEASFIQLESDRQKYWYANRKIRFPEYHTKQHGHSHGASASEADDSYYNFLKDIKLDNEKFIGVEDYGEFLVHYHNKIAKDEAGEQAKPAIIAEKRFKSIIKSHKTDKIRDFLLYQAIVIQLKNKQYEGIDNLINLHNEHSKNVAYKRTINAYYKPLKKMIPGARFTEFTYLDVNGKEYKLDDFKGKYIYVDVWATWCGPCRREIPYLEKLQEDYKGKNIAFMSLSTDKNAATWKNMVTNKQMKGFQLHNNGNQQMSIDYQINGIPRFLLVDKDGNLISMNAPRPSGNIRDFLDSLEGLE